MPYVDIIRFFMFCFQAEDGIRDTSVTGVQTCALPIYHNDGYMSLYGYSQELYKQVGDWVESGEVIASVGDSGGQSQSGLYFEIRKQGKPINPKKWCSSRVQHVALRDI